MTGLLTITSRAVTLLLVIALVSVSFAQSTEPTANKPEEVAGRLADLQSLIDANLVARDELRLRITRASSTTVSELQDELESLNQDLTQLRQSFEQIAIGSIDVDILGEIETSFDWRVEVTQILQPIVENLKALTDKPRKIGKLQSLIEQNALQKETIDNAVAAIEENAAVAVNATTETSLRTLQKTWQRRRADNEQQLEAATVQLAELQNSDVTWWETVRVSATDFFRGRGLTLLIAVIVATGVWFFMRVVLRLCQFKAKGTNQEEYRTRRRLAQYAYRALTLLLILLAVISVFYTRGDLLLMGLSILAAAGVALGLRQAVPRFIAEARLLLNVGSIREHERVMYNGLPWLVTSLNMHSVLRNPELTGVVRLPLSALADMVSRPAAKEPWYPSSKGDFIVLDGDRLMQVIRQTPETIELTDKGGSITAVPTSDFYGWTFKNISRGETFGISTVFGIDYRHQGISLNKIPVRFKEAIEQALVNTPQAEHVVEVAVELQSAGSSSLDFWIYVTLERSAAKGYTKLKRLIQQTCVSVCTQESWGIPFPHLTIQRLSNDD